MNLYQAERSALRECGKQKARQIDRDRIVRLWSDGWTTQQEIADICRCSIATVRKVLIDAGFQREYEICGDVFRVIHREVQE